MGSSAPSGEFGWYRAFGVPFFGALFCVIGAPYIQVCTAPFSGSPVYMAWGLRVNASLRAMYMKNALRDILPELSANFNILGGIEGRIPNVS